MTRRQQRPQLAFCASCNARERAIVAGRCIVCGNAPVEARRPIGRGPLVNVSELRPGDVIYGSDTVTAVTHGTPIASKTTVDTTGGRYTFPTDRRVPTEAY